MNIYFAIAGGVVIVVGLAHSILGELLLLSRISAESLPSQAGDTQGVRRWLVAVFGTTGDQGKRTLRFTWHLPAVFGFGFAGILLRLSLPASPDTYLEFVRIVMIVSFLASALIILVISRGKHPGWVAFLATAILVWLGRT